MKHQSLWVPTLLFLLAVGGASAQTPFTLSSPAVKGVPETGFDSQLVSAGRADPAYNGSTSLPLTWSGLPAGTRAIVLVYDDPDARLVMKHYGVPGDTWYHWLVADVDPALGGLAAGASQTGKLIQGINSGGVPSYQGPEPPADVPAGVKKPIVHIYRLTAYALSSPTGLKKRFYPAELDEALKGRVLAKAELLLSWSN